jgi:magnesium-transporting ATPase (P-type)
VPEASALGDRTSMAYSGTFVVAGRGTGVATGTADKTELGRIGSLIAGIEIATTRFTQKINVFSRAITVITLMIAVAAFGFAVAVRGYGLREAFMTMVGLAVAAIPEGLPAVMTIALAIGVQRMAARKAVIRKLPAVETLGSVSVICSDKTGTLTRNEMTARVIVTTDRSFEVDGTGYEPIGAILADGSEIDPAGDGAVAELARAAALCNDAMLDETEAGWGVAGDPMEGALIALAKKAQIDVDLLRHQKPRIDEIPFDAEHRFMATLHHDHDDDAVILVKGAPERLISMCTQQRGSSGDAPMETARWHRQVEDLAAKGYRTLAFACLPAERGKQDLSFSDVEGGARFLGLVGFIDPPREEAIDAIAECRSAGIRVIMITGDHAATAREIARQLGLADEPKVLTGEEMANLDQAGLQRAALDTHVFARTTDDAGLRQTLRAAARKEALALLDAA